MRRTPAILIFLFGFQSASFAQTDAGTEVTFAEHIAPLIYDNCVVCHRPDGVGPFSLISYREVKKRAQQIDEVVTSRFMPPWKPAKGYGPSFLDERHLTDSQISLIKQWRESGSPSGNLEEAPKPPSFESNWQRGEPDLVLELPEPYILQAEGSDIYRNFVIPISVTSTQYVQAMEFLPRSQLVIHHAVLQIDKTSTSREQDALDPGPGFHGMGIGSSAPPEGQFVGWTPGQSPFESYPGTAWTLEPGSDIVIQLHMLPSGKEEAVSPRIGLYFTDEKPTRSSFVLQMRNFNIDIAPGEADYHFEETIEIPVDSEIIGVYPHAHYIGKDLGAYAIFPDGSKHWLFRIPDWDFNWQSDYRYEQPIQIPAGTTIHMRYSYDNSEANIRNPNSPPKRIVGGWNSTDEMGELSIQILPIEEQDLSALKEAQLKYNIDSAGGQSRYAYNFGNYFELQGLLEKAGEYYYAALQAEPSLASAHYKLGHVLERLGNSPGAERSYRQALALRPELIPANIGLARIHYQNRNDFLAVDLLEQVLKWEAHNLDARIYLARIHQSNTNLEKALSVLETGLPYHQANPYFRLELGKLHYETGQTETASTHFRYAMDSEVASRTPISQKETQSLKSEASYSIALIHVDAKQLADAETYLQKAIKAMPHNYPAILASATIAFDKGNSEHCLMRLEQIAALPDAIRPPIERIANARESPEWIALVNEAMR